MSKKPGLPLERHIELGAELVRIRERLMAIHIEIANAHPKASRVALRAQRPVAAVDDLRCALDSVVCAMDGGGPQVYYPGPAVDDTTTPPPIKRIS
jgi:putative heme degradation protein